MGEGVKIGSNISSLNAQRQLGEAKSNLSKIYERLSSGQRINRASDDAAGLAISSTLNAGARVLKQALVNVNDGVSAASIAEGALGTLRDISMRQRELVTQAANGSYTLAQRRALNAEANALVSEYNRIVQSTQFNGRALFQNGSQQLNIQAGTGITGNIAFTTGSQLSRNVGDGTFRPAVTFAGADPGSTIAADIDNNGVLDLVIARYGSGFGPTLVRSVNGTLQAAELVGDTGLRYIAAGDFNADGRIDIAGTLANGAAVSVMLQNANGSFATGVNYAIGTTDDQPIAAADLNGDGRADLVVGDRLANTVVTRLANADGTFGGATTTAAGTWPGTLAIGDFNGDGKADVAVGGGTDCSVLISNGDGTFQPRKMLASDGSDFAVAADFDGNGYTDIATLDGVFLSNGDGTFKNSMTFGLSGTAASAADVNGDGYQDVVIGDGAVGTARIMAGKGDGTFTMGQTFAICIAGQSMGNLATGDIDGDGRTDLALGGATAGVSLARGPAVATTPCVNITTRQGALAAMEVIDQNLQRISNELGYIGATTSRFEVTLATLRARSENYSAASSRILDADMASESASLIANQIRQQVATGILAQANQQQQIAISLLRGA